MDKQFAIGMLNSSIGGMPKITMPSMPRSVPREKIFARLDGFESYALVWVSAPAGYGKSSALSSYLRHRGRPAVWYQCDAGDADIASFFHHLTVARSQIGKSSAIPALFPQHLSAAAVFCRNFFRQWFTGLPRRSALILDNWQDVPAGCALKALLPTVAEEVPDGFQLIVISRDEPDAGLSRCIAGQRLAQLDVEDLKLSRAETAAIVRAQSRDSNASRVDIDALHRSTQGWAAAVTLLLRRRDTAPASVGREWLGSPQAVFDYLAAEVFERLDPSFQEFLPTLSCLDHIAVSVARRISTRAKAGAMLETLTRHNVFTSYRAVSDSYHFHPLFRSFLLRKFQATHSAADQRSFLIAVADALEAEGDAEAGIRLLIRAGTWPEAASLIRSVASTYVDQARLATLSEWIEALPSDFLADDGWLVYWRGVCRLTLDFRSARADLERSHQRFVLSGDRAGQALACAAILQHIAYTYLDYRELIPWIERLESLLDAGRRQGEAPGLPPQGGSSGVELRVWAAFMLALSQGVPNHPKLIDSVARVAELVQREQSIVGIAEGASALLHFFSRFGRTPQYGNLDATVARLLDDPGLPPIHRLNLLWLHAYRLHSSGDPAAVLCILREARALARSEGLDTEDTRMRLCELQAQEPGAAEALCTFSELEPLVRGMPPIPRAHFLYVRSIFELGCGHLEQALKYAEEALPLIRASHWYIGQALSLTGLAEVYCAAGRHEEAAQCVAECALITRDVPAPLIEFNLQLVRAELARIRHDGAAFAAALARAFALGREQGYANGFHTSSQLLRRLIPYGIELDIEPSYCRWVIAKRGFSPPCGHHARWPWPVRIRVLGKLQIYLQGVELVVKGKAPRKPMDILKLLGAHPGGLEMGRVMDELWPDLDGDASRNALDITLHRLRKMLRSKEAILLTNGKLCLNAKVVWIDTAALERVGSSPRSSSALLEEREELLDLYRGDLLGEEAVGGAMLAARERLRRGFIRRVVRLAANLEDAHREEEAAALFLRAVERDSADESIHRALSQALCAAGARIKAPGRAPEGAARR